jgi:hypothetical protein
MSCQRHAELPRLAGAILDRIGVQHLRLRLLALEDVRDELKQAAVLQCREAGPEIGQPKVLAFLVELAGQKGPVQVACRCGAGARSETPDR